MLLKEFWHNIGNMRSDLKDLDVIIIAPNGIEMEPVIKIRLEIVKDENGLTSKPAKIIITHA